MTKPLELYNPFDPEILKCPYEFNKELREQAPVYQCPHTGVFFVSTYDLVVKVAKNEKLFSNKFSMMQAGAEPPAKDEELNNIRKQGFPSVETMLTQDPPEQRRYRALCQKPFSASSVTKLQPYIENLANELIDQFIDDGQCNWMDAFAVPMPVRMIAYILGVPIDDLALFKEWSDASVYQFAADQNRAEVLRSAQLVVDFQHYFAEKIEARQKQPTDDVLSDIVNSNDEGEEPMNVAECLSVISQLVVAGNETTTSTFAEGLHLLATHPEQLRKVQEDPSLIPNMVEEMLRLSTPTTQMWRIALQDTELNGVKIPKGATLMIKFGSANRDEMQFAFGEEFDVTRQNLKSQIAFGKGVHHCLGAPLARQELIVSFKVILERMTNFTLPPEQGDLEFLPSMLLHGPADLSIRFDKK
jgi:cytochrome P450